MARHCDPSAEGPSWVAWSCLCPPCCVLYLQSGAGATKRRSLPPPGPLSDVRRWLGRDIDDRSRPSPRSPRPLRPERRLRRTEYYPRSTYCGRNFTGARRASSASRATQLPANATPRRREWVCLCFRRSLRPGGAECSPRSRRTPSNPRTRGSPTNERSERGLPVCSPQRWAGGHVRMGVESLFVSRLTDSVLVELGKGEGG